ncbi:hypothetical protein [Mucilaginibacter ginkgonis]|uniref:Uncharacterized protein n=1 Tax=Mucilaginibacter ginkgonis TaxID=2682091 RepID=A0A6I4HZI8_9SPHI|nr:hypothetical protein [Mucilaginibacter ginkgonis]QQL50131.1 hypothetical protein GO620_001385 [Mucilaginibacter ginkgonis]
MLSEGRAPVFPAQRVNGQRLSDALNAFTDLYRNSVCFCSKGEKAGAGIIFNVKAKNCQGLQWHTFGLKDGVKSLTVGTGKTSGIF